MTKRIRDLETLEFVTKNWTLSRRASKKRAKKLGYKFIRNAEFGRLKKGYNRATGTYSIKIGDITVEWIREELEDKTVGEYQQLMVMSSFETKTAGKTIKHDYHLSLFTKNVLNDKKAVAELRKMWQEVYSKYPTMPEGVFMESFEFNRRINYRPDESTPDSPRLAVFFEYVNGQLARKIRILPTLQVLIKRYIR